MQPDRSHQECGFGVGELASKSVKIPHHMSCLVGEILKGSPEIRNETRMATITTPI